MGEVEVVLSDEEGMEVVLQEKEEEREIEKENKESSTTMIKRDRFLPRVFLRILLVEADDSTRQIVTALLRKCGYRVAAVSDGIKAWEALKGRPQNIDLILTEVELPLISGVSLLTLIMEHDICKNIPVIMMSSHDSASMVFKCMLGGAADFLIKPVRKNELRNLWQHVWRRQLSAGGGQVCRDGSLAQQKVGAISESNAMSNYSSECVAWGQKNRECSGKGNDTESSCTKPDTEAESICMHDMRDLLTPTCRGSSLASGRKIQRHGECVRLDEEFLMHEGKGEDNSMRLESEVAPWNEVNGSARLVPGEDRAYGQTMTYSVDVGPGHSEGANKTSQTHDNNYERDEPSREAIDLLGAFDKHPGCMYEHAYNIAIQEILSNDTKFHSGSNEKSGLTKLLELSLKRSHPSESENQRCDERHTLNHSKASAFSWYNSRTVQPLFPTASPCTEPKECSSKSCKHMPKQDYDKTADAPQQNGSILNNNQESMTSLVHGQSGQAETALPCCRLGVKPVPVPVRGIMFDGLCASYDTKLPPMLCSQSDQLPNLGQISGGQQESTCHLNSSHESNPETHYPEQVYHFHDQNADNSTDQGVHEQKEHNLEYVKDPRDVSPASGQSVNSSLCNGVSHLNSSGSGNVCNGSNGNVTQAAAARATAKSGNDEGLFIHDGIRGMDAHHSSQREAALTKFRLKRKDRCYEKKVRYQSRKRLAEQRPRVKGQFVRQVPHDQTTH